MTEKEKEIREQLRLRPQEITDEIFEYLKNNYKDVKITKEKQLNGCRFKFDKCLYYATKIQIDSSHTVIFYNNGHYIGLAQLNPKR